MIATTNITPPVVRRRCKAKSLPDEKKQMTRLMTLGELSRVRAAHFAYCDFITDVTSRLPTVKKHRFSKSTLKDRLNASVRCWKHANHFCHNVTYCDICLSSWRSGLLYGLAKRPKRSVPWVWRTYYVLDAAYTPQQFDYLWNMRLFPELQQQIKTLRATYMPEGLAYRFHSYVNKDNCIVVGATVLLVLNKAQSAVFEEDLEFAECVPPTSMEKLHVLAPLYWELNYPLENVPVPHIHFWRSVHPLKFSRYRTDRKNRVKHYIRWRFRQLSRLESVFPSTARQLERIDKIMPLELFDRVFYAVNNMSRREGCLGATITSQIGSIYKKEEK